MDRGHTVLLNHILTQFISQNLTVFWVTISEQGTAKERSEDTENKNSKTKS